MFGFPKWLVKTLFGVPLFLLGSNQRAEDARKSRSRTSASSGIGAQNDSSIVGDADDGGAHGMRLIEIVHVENFQKSRTLETEEEFEFFLPVKPLPLIFPQPMNIERGLSIHPPHYNL